MDNSNFLDYFNSITDPRSQKNQLHSVNSILFLTLCAVICGAEGWIDIENFGNIKLEFLKKYVNFNNGIPSDDTLRRFFRSLDIKEFKDCFSNWASSFKLNSDIKIIAIDGKTSRRSHDQDQKALHMLSAFATDARLVLGQEKVDEKSNEITAIPKLLKILDLKGAIVTIDAMGTQHHIANQIVSDKADYVLSLKGNQGNLNDDVREYLVDTEICKNLKSFKTIDGEHGRIETRQCWVSNDVSWLHKRNPKWSSINTIVRIHSTREIKDKMTNENRYYISSLNVSAEQILHVIRSHWRIENSLHWVLDMSFGDDQSRTRKKNAPSNMAIIKHAALNIIRQIKPKGQSIKRMRKISGWSDKWLNTLLSTFFS